MTTERTISLYVKLQDAQTILNALSALPYAKVSQLIADLVAQIQTQANQTSEKGESAGE